RDRGRPRASYDAAARGTRDPTRPRQAARACGGAAAPALPDRRPLAVLRAPRSPNRRRRVSARRLDVGLPCKENGDVGQQRSGSCHRHRAARGRARAGRGPPVPVRGRPVTALAEPEFWARLAGIILIDLTLAGDNALVIALAVRTLPKRQQFFGRLWGTAGAVVLRLAFIVVATRLLTIPLLQLVGGVLLVWIALRLVRQNGESDGHARQGTTLSQAVWIIMIADAAMSLDNVLGVAAAAHGDLLLVVLGIGLSLPLVVWGSGLLAWLMTRFTWIIWLGGGVLGYVAGEMIPNDRVADRWLGALAGRPEAGPLTLAPGNPGAGGPACA